MKKDVLTSGPVSERGHLLQGTLLGGSGTRSLPYALTLVLGVSISTP